LFIASKQSGANYVLGGHEVRTLSFLEAMDNNCGITADIKLNETLDEANVNLTHRYQGHRAYMYRFFLAIDDVKENLKTSLFTNAIQDVEYKSFTLENKSVDLNTDNSKYLKVNSKFTTRSLIDQAGNDVLIHVGKIIGKQNEMYEERERTTDVILSEPIHYTHKINVHIPYGYEVKGLDQLDINNVVKQNNETILRFVCGYTYKNNILSITINEDYEVLELDKKSYNDYRKVVNSAADINKIILVLEPS